MSAVGWVLATGLVTGINDVATRPKDVDTIDYVKIGVATGAAAVIVSLVAKASPTLASALAIGSFVTVAIAPLNGKQAPVTTVLNILKRVKVAS